jgi:hypothetical protein
VGDSKNSSVSEVTTPTQQDVVVADSAAMKKDSIKAEVSTPAPDSVTISEKPDTTATSTAATPTDAAATQEVVSPKTYEEMDARVRTGAYRIVGTAYEEKVRAGDNLQKISRRTLGPGMECYVEVYNNMKASTVLTEGQTIKIPKLSVKKIKK